MQLAISNWATDTGIVSLFQNNGGATTNSAAFMGIADGAFKAEVDELFAEWKAAAAKIVSEPEDKPSKLREFMTADPDANVIRAFYDFRLDG